MSKKRQKYAHLYTRLYLQVFVVGARQTLESHHESCTLQYKNTKRGIGFENQHQQVSLAPTTIFHYILQPLTQRFKHTAQTLPQLEELYIYHIAKKHRQDDD